ncbi:MAG TPA: glycosyltransferase family 87 protein [Acidimicrobiales bacterium]|nr:glycosyltransferase family 87 protein [Acidimicrobiales bacterium]
MTNKSRALQGALWALAILGTLALGYERYHSNAWAVPGDFRSRGDDFWIFFHASHLVASGLNPYHFGFGSHGDGYVYSPLVALVLWPFLHLGISTVWHLWLIASIAALVAGVLLVMKAEGPFERDWRRPVLFGIMIGSILRFMPTTVNFNNGNSDAFVLVFLAASVLASERGRSATSGALLAFGGIVKTWPWAIALIFFRRDFPRRWRTLIAFLLTSLIAPILALILGGTSELSSLIHVTLHASSQRLVSCSVWGAPQALFSKSGFAQPLFVSAPLRWITTVILAVWAISILVRCLRWSDSTRLSFWNIVGCVLLLLPVSHADYTLLIVPILWIWVARALALNTLRSPTTYVAGAMCVWWLALFPTAFFNWLPSAWSVDVEIPFVANLLMVTVSILGDHYVRRESVDSPTSTPEAGARKRLFGLATPS